VIAKDSPSRPNFLDPGYTLVITEKPDAGRRIAKALGELRSCKFEGVEIWDIPSSFDGTHFVVCSALGHLFGVYDPGGKRSLYPVFDVTWASKGDILSKKKSNSNFLRTRHATQVSQFTRRIKAISKLSQNASDFVQACDSDLEGETIGFNILKYACGKTNLEKCKRARFSSLTENELRESFSNLETINQSFAQAGCTRHVIDFLWGINLSRALSGAYLNSGRGFRNITTGRVQGPTLSFVIDREIAIKTHVPVPFWTIRASIVLDGAIIEAKYEKLKIETILEAKTIVSSCSKINKARVTKISNIAGFDPPPFPFNLTDLQTEMFRIHGFSPSTTLKFAERLYLRALISYPRTNSQRLPKAIGSDKIINSTGLMPEYRNLVQYLTRSRRVSPVEGPKIDPAHPAIYPTGERPKKLSLPETKVYDLIVRRFLAAFAEDAKISGTTAFFEVGTHVFSANGEKLAREGWSKIYSMRKIRRTDLSALREGMLLDVQDIKVDSEFSRPPNRFTQGSLLLEMEAKGIGTKSTRSEIISTLIDRGYLTQEKAGILEGSEIGYQLAETMRSYCKEIISVELTRKIESEIEQVSEDKISSSEVLDHTKSAVSNAVQKIVEFRSEIGKDLASAANVVRKVDILGNCPSCHNGELRIIKSTRTGKRFIGCSNYRTGCRTSAPLPQRGNILSQGRTCNACKWPLIRVNLRPRMAAWIICPNVNCIERRSR
jgi:DNA topoisomerase-1